jgi:integrase
MAANTNRRRSPGEGAVYFDASKDRWIAAVMVDGRRRKVSAKTKTAALKEIKALSSPSMQFASGNMTVSAVFDSWLERGLPARRVKGHPLAPRTMELHRWYAGLWKTEIGTKRIAKLTVEDVEAALDRMTKATATRRLLGVSSLSHARQTLGFVLDYAVRRKYMTVNVARFALSSPDARQPRPRRSMTLDQARLFIEAVKGDRLEAMFLMQITLGLRPGEAAGLLWESVDLTKGRIRVEHARRTENEQPVLVDRLKTARSYRTLDLPAVAFEALRSHRIRQLAEREAAKEWRDDRLVFTATNGAILRAENVRRDLKAITRAAGIGDWSPNELRHTAASILSDDGTRLEQIADLLGHVDTSMLERVYRHNIADSINAAAPMDRILG